MNITKYHVDKVKGAKDITAIRGEIQNLEGIHAVRVDDVANTITVEYEDEANKESITQTISKYANIRS